MMTITYETINEYRHARRYTVLTVDGYETMLHCPNCRGLFKKAPRCPECGQLVTRERNAPTKIKVRLLK